MVLKVYRFQKRASLVTIHGVMDTIVTLAKQKTNKIV